MAQKLGYSKFIEMESSWIWLNLEKSWIVWHNDVTTWSTVGCFMGFHFQKNYFISGGMNQIIRVDPNSPEIARNSIQNFHDWYTLTEKYLILN